MATSKKTTSAKNVKTNVETAKTTKAKTTKAKAEKTSKVKDVKPEVVETTVETIVEAVEETTQVEAPVAVEPIVEAPGAVEVVEETTQVETPAPAPVEMLNENMTKSGIILNAAEPIVSGPEIITDMAHYMSLEDASTKVPALVATQKHESRSDKYSMIQTADLVKMFMDLGWEIKFASGRGKAETGQHLIKMVNPKMAAIDKGADKMVPEVAIYNSHDGTTRLKVLVGLYRIICSNGLIVGVPGMHNTMQLRHTGITTNDVKILSEQTLNNFEVCSRYINDMKEIELTFEQREKYALDALYNRDTYLFRGATEEERMAKVRNMYDVEGFMKANREEDAAPTLWATYNNAQEKLLEVGFARNLGEGKKSKMTPIKSIARNVQQNLQLFKAATELMPAEINQEFESYFDSKYTEALVEKESKPARETIKVSGAPKSTVAEPKSTVAEHVPSIEEANIDHIEVEHVIPTSMEVSQHVPFIANLDDEDERMKPGMVITSIDSHKSEEDTTETFNADGTIATKRTVKKEDRARGVKVSHNGQTSEDKLNNALPDDLFTKELLGE